MARGQKLALLARDAYIRSVQGEGGNFMWQHWYSHHVYVTVGYVVCGNTASARFPRRTVPYAVLQWQM